MMTAIATALLLSAAAPAPASAPASLVGVATASFESGDQQALVLVDPPTGHFAHVQKLPTTIGGGGVIPTTFAAVPPISGAVFVAYERDFRECIHLVSLANGSAIGAPWCSKLVLTNLVYDHRADRVLFNGYNTTLKQNAVYELHYRAHPRTAELLVVVPGIVNTCVAAYSAATSTLFLTTQVQEPQFGNNLVAVDIAARNVTANVWCALAIEILMVDETATAAQPRLWAWGASETDAAILTALDPVTGGAVGAPLVQYKQYSANGGAATVGPDSTFYSTLLAMDGSGDPFWVAVEETAAGGANATVTPMLPRLYKHVLGMDFLAVPAASARTTASG